MSRIVTAADCKVFINGKPFGIATAATWNATVGRRAIYGIDNETPFELAPGQRAIKGRMDVVRLHQDRGLEGSGVMAPDSSTMLEKYITIIILDRNTDDILLDMQKAAADNQNWGVHEKGVLAGSFTFEGIGWSVSS